MVVRDVGKMRSFRISFWALALLGGFLAVFVFVSVTAINQYLALRPLNRDREDRIHELEQNLSSLEKELQRSRQYAVLLEEVIARREAVQHNDAGPEADESQEGRSTGQTAGSPGKRIGDVVGVEDLTVTKQGTKLTVQFRLVKLSEGESPADGHVYIIAMNGSTQPPQFWTYPKVALREGVPVEYQRGEYFKIRRFKMIRGVYFLDTEAERPSSIKVIVYDTSGELMLEKEIEVDSDKIREGVH